MNNELVKIESGKAVTTSKIIAEKYGKEHKHVLRDVSNIFETLEKDLPKIGPMFKESDYKDKYGRSQPCFEINRDGFMLLVMGFTGAEALRTKLAFIEAFDMMEEELKRLSAASQITDPVYLKTAFRECKAIAEIAGLTGNMAIIAADQAAKKLTGHSPLELIGQQHLVSESQEINLTPTEIGKEIGGLSAIAVNKLLAANGLQRKVGKNWAPTDDGMKYAVLMDTGKKHSNGTPIQQLKWKESVIEVIK